MKDIDRGKGSDSPSEIDREDDPDTSESRAYMFHELNRTRRKLRSLADFTDVVLDSLPGILLIIDESERLVRWNANLAYVTGYTAREIKVMSPLDFFDERDRPLISEGILNALLRDQFSVEGRLLTSEDDEVPYLFTMSRVELDGIAHLVAMGVDIGDRKAAEDQLAYQAQLLADVSDAVVSSEPFDRNFLIRSWNKGAERVYGWTAAEAIGRPYGDLLRPEYNGVPRSEVIAKFESVGRFEGEVMHRRKDGSRVDIWTSVARLTSPAGEPIGVVAVNRDITALKRAREAVAESEQQYRHLVEDMQDVVYALDEAGVVTYISPRVEVHTGWVPDDIIGRNFLEFVHPDDRDEMIEHYSQQLLGARLEGEFRIIDKRGDTHWVRSSSRAIEQTGAITGVRGVLVDITDRKRIEEENLRIAKIESLAVLAGGVAHDFNSILTSVTANLSIAAEEAVAGEDVSRSIAEARRAAAMAKSLTQRLLSLSKGGAPVKQVILIGETVAESARFALSGATSRLELRIARGVWPVEADPSQIASMVENLVLNADQAMGEGGTVTVVLENVGPPPVEDGRRPSFPPDRSIRLTVSDGGCGIPEADLQRIFDPYFTTKEHGSGLGLASVHTVVSRHGGRISVSSEVGEGTTFTVTLPAATGTVTRSSAPPRPIAAAGERVLVMDDDKLVQSSAERALTRLGYDVEIAADGDAAIGKYVEALGSGRRFDLVIMDLVIPGGIGGKEVVQRLLEIDPGVRAIVSSGYSSDPVMSDHLEHGFRAAVAKPWDLAEISHRIREVLDSD